MPDTTYLAPGFLPWFYVRRWTKHKGSLKGGSHLLKEATILQRFRSHSAKWTHSSCTPFSYPDGFPSNIRLEMDLRTCSLRWRALTAQSYTLGW